MSNNVKFGDKIIFYGYQEDEKLDITGVMSASGFCNKNIYLEKNPKKLFESGNTGASCIRNYRDFVFQIWPKLDFESHKEYKRLVKQVKQIEDEIKNIEEQVDGGTKDLKKQKEYLEDLKEKVVSMNQRKENEKKNNFKQLSVVQGRNITYGQQIFLQHVDSQMFMCGSVLASNSDKSAYQLELSDKFCKGMIFKIIPRYKLRQEGEIVQFNDQILIENIKVNGKTNFSGHKISDIDDNSNIEKTKSYLLKELDIKKQDGRKRYDCFLSNTIEITWQMFKFAQANDTDINLIRGGDFIYLYHNELSGELSADYQYKTDFTETFIRKYQGEWQEECNSVRSVWEIETNQTEYRGQEINISPLHTVLSSSNNSIKKYKLRHFLTGKLMTINQVNIEGKQCFIPCLTKEDKDEDNEKTDLIFLSTNGDDISNMINNQSYMLIGAKNQVVNAQQSINFKIINNGKFAKKKKDVPLITLESQELSDNENMIESKQKNKNKKDIMKKTFTSFKQITEENIYEPLEDEEMQIVRTGVDARDRSYMTEENAFRIIKISKEDQEDLLFINSAYQILKKVLENFKSNKQLPKELLKQANNAMQQLVFFIVKTDSDNALTCQGISMVSRQRMMKDFQMIEIFMDLLYYPFRTGLYDLDKLYQQDPDIIKLFQLTYRLVNHTIKEYRPNELYASQWINLMIRQSMLTDKKCDIGAEETLTELIDNNKKILENKIDSETIDKFIQMLYDEREAKYVKLLRALTVCDGEAMVKNQGQISYILLETSQIKQRLLFNIQGKPNKIMVRSMLQNTEEYILLSDLYKLSNEVPMDELVGYKFYVEMILLLSELCQDRNYKAIKPLEKLFPQDLCMQIIQDEQFEQDMRQAFTKLVISLWVDKFPYRKIALPEKIRVWDEIEKKKDEILSCTEKIDDMQTLKKFVSKFLIIESKKGCQKSYLEDENKFIFSVLELTEKMIMFGFYQSVDEINHLLQNLLSLLNGSFDVCSEEEYQKLKEKLSKNANFKGKMFNVANNIGSFLGFSGGSIKSGDKQTARYEETEKNIIVHQCKILICKILRDIIFLRNNIRLSKFLSYFKKDELADKNVATELIGNVLGGVKNLINMNPFGNIFAEQESEQEKEEKKPIGWINEILSENQIDIFGNSDKDIIVVLLDLTLYQCPELVNISFEILNDLFSQRIILVDQLKTLQLLEDEEQIATYKEIQQIEVSLSDLSEKSENWLHETDTKSINDAKKVLKMLNRLYEMLQTGNKGSLNDNDMMEDIILEEPDAEEIPINSNKIKSSKKKKPSQQFDISSPKASSLGDSKTNQWNYIFKKGQKRNAVNQRLFRNSKIYRLIVELISFDAGTFSSYRQNGAKKYLDTETVHTCILRKCYQILGRFVHKNDENKKIINQYSEYVILKHTETFPQLFVCNLLVSLYSDNKQVIKNQIQFSKALKTICSCVVNLLKQKQYSLAASYLQTLNVLTSYKDKIIKNNQTEIINTMTFKDYDSIIMTLVDSNQQSEFFKEIKKISNENLELGSIEPQEVPGIVDYFNCFMYVISIICDEMNNATESKAQGYFSLEHLQQLLDKTSECIYVRQYLLFFFYHVYLDTEREMNEELLVIKKKAIFTIQEDIKEITITYNTSHSIFLNYQGKISMKEMKENYFFNALFLCIETIIKKQMIEQKDELDIFIEDIENAIVVMAQNTYSLQKQNRQKLKNLVALLIYQELTTTERMKQLLGDYRAEYIPNNRFIKNIKRGTISTHRVELKSIKNLNSEGQIVSRADNLDSRIEKFIEKKVFKEQKHDELRMFVDAITGVREKSLIAFEGLCTLDYNELAQSIINFMLEKSDTSEELSLRRIQVLRQIIELENKNTTDAAIDWEGSDFDEFSHRIIKRQNSLVDLGIVKLIVTSISNENCNKEMMHELLLLGISLLLGGNKYVQDAFYEQFQEDVQNKFLHKIKETITTTFARIKKSMNKYNAVLFEQKMQEEEDINQQQSIKNDKKQNIKDQKTSMKVLNMDQEQGKLMSIDQNDNLDTQINEEEEEESIHVDEEELEEITYLIQIYRFLQLFCEGHNLQMQNYLREQKIGNEVIGRSYNFIFQGAIIFSSIVKFINNHSVSLGAQIMDFLVETIQGPCPENQINLTRAKIIDICKDFLNKFQKDLDYEKFGFETQDQKDEIDSLVTSSTTLLISLLEGNANQEIYDQMYESLDLQDLIIRLKNEYYDLKSKYKVKNDNIQKITEKIGAQFDDELMNSFNIYILLRTMADKEKSLQSKLERQSKKTLKALQFFAHHTGSIEVMFKDQLVRVYFPIQPICRMISVNTRRTLMQDVSRDSPNEKVEGLMKAATDLYDEMNHLSYLNTLIINFSTDRFNKLRLASTLIAFIINVTMIYSYNQDLKDKINGNEQVYTDDTNYLPFHQIIWIIGYVQLGTSSLMMITWFIINAPLILKAQWREEVEQNRANLKDEILHEDEDMDQDIDNLSSQEATRLLLYYGPDAKIFNKKEGKRNFGNGFTKMQYYWIGIRCLLNKGIFRYMTFYIATTIAGQFVSPVVFCFHLLDIVSRFPTLLNVIKAVTTNVKQLLLTSFLGIILLYIYALLAFYFIDDTYVFGSVVDYDGSSNDENQCTSLLQCFIVTINQGLIKGGGIGDVISQLSFDPDYHDLTRWYVKWVFDLSFFMLIKMAFLNIIFGVIIDTFAQLRDAKSTIDDDMKNVCFICSLNRETFDRFADGFENHIERDHQLWYYVYYVYHIQNLDKTSHNGIESFVSHQYEHQEYSWFPMLRSLSIVQEEEEDNNQKISEQIEDISNQISNLKDKITEALLKKKLKQE